MLLNINTYVLPPLSSRIFFRVGSSVEQERFICDIVVIKSKRFERWLQMLSYTAQSTATKRYAVDKCDRSNRRCGRYDVFYWLMSLIVMWSLI